MLVWIQAARLKTLTSSFFPSAAGILLAFREGFFNFYAATATLTCALMLQILTNYANDYFDFKKGADTKERIGPTRVTASGLVTPSEIQQAIFLIIAFCLLIGVYLVHVGGFPILAIGILSILFAIGYTAGPYPLAYLGLGDLFAFIFFGPVACFGSYYLQAHSFDISPSIVGSLFGFLSVSLLDTNNLRDFVQDKKNNKKTIVVRYGETFGKKVYATSLYSSLLLIPFLIYLNILPPLAAITFALYPMAKKNISFCYKNSGENIIPLLQKTVTYQILYGFIICGSLLI